MATPTKPNNRIRPYVRKTFKDEFFRAYVPPPLPPDPPLVLQPLLPLLEQAKEAEVHRASKQLRQHTHGPLGVIGVDVMLHSLFTLPLRDHDELRRSLRILI
jgi:hypothetical protein